MTYYTPATLSTLAKVNRLARVMVRMERCRFTCAAQDAHHIIAALETAGDHCRDVAEVNS